MSLPRYGEYKDSGVEWLGDIPTHWEPSRLKRVVSLVESGVSVNAVDEPATVGSIGVLKTSCVYDGNFDPSENKAVVLQDIERVACPVKAGTLIVSRMNTPALVGAAGLVDADAANLFLPDRLWQVHFSGALPKFVYFWTGSPSYRAQVQMACAGTSASMQNLSQDEFLRFVVPLPPLDEQAAIAAFLDRETGKIDALIAEQEKLIALLAEKRQATISHAVTKGLDPKAPMKDSGVAWLGEVPVHWSACALSYLASIETGATPDRAEPSYWNGSIPWLKTGEINWTPIREAEEFITDAGLENSAAKIAKPGTLLMAMYGQGVTRGRVALLEIEATFNQACAAMRFGHRIAPEFARYVFMAAYDHVRDAGNETSQMNLSAGLIAKIRLPVPPADEQVAIVRFLDAETRKLDELGACAQHAIVLLKERRSALIAAAVTGQIDVRHA